MTHRFWITIALFTASAVVHWQEWLPRESFSWFTVGFCVGMLVWKDDASKDTLRRHVKELEAELSKERARKAVFGGIPAMPLPSFLTKPPVVDVTVKKP